MSGLCGGCFCEAVGYVNRVNGWEAGLRDGLGFVHDTLQFLVVLARAGAIPSCDTNRKNAFHGASVKIGESRSGQIEFPLSSEKVEALMGFFNYSVIMGGPGHVVGDLGT